MCAGQCEGTWEEVELCTGLVPGHLEFVCSSGLGLCPAFSLPPRPPRKPGSLLTRDPGEEQPGKMQKGKLQQQGIVLLTQVEPAAATAQGAEQASQRARAFKGLVAAHSAQSGPSAGSQR